MEPLQMYLSRAAKDSASDIFFVPCTAEDAADPVSLPVLAALYSALIACFCFHLENQLVFVCSC